MKAKILRILNGEGLQLALQIFQAEEQAKGDSAKQVIDVRSSVPSRQ